MMQSASVPASLLALAAFALPAAAGETMYALSGPVNPSLLTIDSSTGAVLSSVTVTGEEALFGGLTFTLDGSALYSIDGYNDGNSDRTFRVDPATGTGTVVGDTGHNWNFRQIEFDPADGTLYASRDNELYTINLTTGAATSVGPITGSTLNQATALAISASGQAFMTDTGGVGLFSLDLSTGALTHLGDLGTPNFFQDLAFDASGVLWGIGFAGGGLYRIDTTNVTAVLAYASPAYAGITFRRPLGPGSPYCFGNTASGNPCPCGNDNDGTTPLGGCEHDDSTAGALLDATGFASVSGDTLVLRGTRGPISNSTLFFQANNNLDGAGVFLDDGIQCAGGGLVRLGVRNTDGSGQADTSGYGYTVSARSATFGHPISAGETLYYQWWVRDPGGSPCGNDANTSNGYQIVWTP